MWWPQQPPVALPASEPSRSFGVVYHVQTETREWRVHGGRGHVCDFHLHQANSTHTSRHAEMYAPPEKSSADASALSLLCGRPLPPPPAFPGTRWSRSIASPTSSGNRRDNYGGPCADFCFRLMRAVGVLCCPLYLLLGGNLMRRGMKIKGLCVLVSVVVV